MMALMSRAAVVIGGLVWALAIGACATPSVHPIYREGEPVFSEPGLVGTWKAADAKETYAVTRAGDVYHMLVKNNDAKDPKQWEFAVRLVKVGDTNFADFAAVEEERQAHEDHWGTLFIATHMFAAWALDKDTLTVRMLDRDWLAAGTREGRVKLAHTKLDDHSLLITAQTDELRAFLKEFGKDEKAFNDVVKLERAKP